MSEFMLIESDFWRETRVKAAIAAMSANCMNPELMQFVTQDAGIPFEAIAKASVRLADTLVAELKRTEEEAKTAPKPIA